MTRSIAIVKDLSARPGRSNLSIAASIRNNRMHARTAARQSKAGICDLRPDGVDHPHRVALLDAGAHQCRWPLWTDEDTHRDVCGGPVCGGSVYCAGHRSRAKRRGD